MLWSEDRQAQCAEVVLCWMPASSHAEGWAWDSGSASPHWPRAAGTGLVTALSPPWTQRWRQGRFQPVGTGDMGHRSRGLRPQGPASAREPTGVMAGKFLVSAELHRVTASCSAESRAAPLHPQDTGKWLEQGAWSEARTGCAVDQRVRLSTPWTASFPILHRLLEPAQTHVR